MDIEFKITYMEQFKVIRKLNKVISKSPWVEWPTQDEISEAVREIFKEYRDSLDIADHYRYLGNDSKFNSLTKYANRLLDRLDYFVVNGEWEVKAIINWTYKNDKNSPYLN